jgi:hypothetical protein
MKTTMVLLGLALMAPVAQCQIRATLSEQKTCSDRAEKMADRWRHSIKLDNKDAEVYQTNHFQGGRCLVLIQQDIPHETKMFRLIDAFENNPIGDYLESSYGSKYYDASKPPERCEVAHQTCSSLSEFRHLVHQKFGLAE